MHSHFEPLAIVFSLRRGDWYRAGRTARAAGGLGMDAVDATGESPEALGARLCALNRPAWLLQAGTWPCAVPPIAFPRASASGRPLVAFGRIVAQPGAMGDGDARAWDRLLRAGGGELQAHEPIPAELRKASVFLEPRAAHAVGRIMRRGVAFDRALERALLAGYATAEGLPTAAYRLVHCDCLDVADDERRRVLQVITTLQRGGAERVALDLAIESPRFGVRSRIATLGRPTRGSFAAPADVLDVSTIAGRAERIEAVRAAALDWHVDVIHAHLLRGEEVAALARGGVPVVVTVHNSRAGWPPGMESLSAGDASLVVACAQAVEAELERGSLPLAVRTAWNGIDFGAFRADRRRDATRLRRRWGFAADDFVLLAVSNPRPQKRWAMLPGVLRAAQCEFARRGIRRRVRLVVAGETEQLAPDAADCVAEFERFVRTLGLVADVRLAGLVADVPCLVAAADAAVCTSAYEGLSLAHLEAYAAGKPIVATDVGGTREIAAEYRGCRLVGVAADPAEFAAALGAIAERGADVGSDAHAASLGRSSFSRFRMAERYAWLYDRAIARSRWAKRSVRRFGSGGGRGGLLLVANNFSTGGAQSSARRLLLAIAERGIRVRAAVVEEQPEYPTAGRTALMQSGVNVLAAPPAGTVDPADAVRTLLETIDADPPEAVLFWNLIAEYKVLLADALVDVPVVDVSPGEMFYTSLERYFSRPRPGLPYRTATEYGRRLRSVVVKYAAEAEAAAALGAPVRVIPNGVPLPAMQRREACAMSADGRLAIGTSARISPQKKLEELIAAVRRAHRRLPPYVLRIAGRVEPGCEEYAGQLRALARGLNVEFVGEFDDAGAFLPQIDLFAMISEPAGCPNASLEAMAHGLCVVATDYGGVAEQVIDGVTGRLVPRGDCDGLAAALVELASDRPQRERLAAAARRHVAEKFGMARMAAAYLDVCELRGAGKHYGRRGAARRLAAANAEGG